MKGMSAIASSQLTHTHTHTHTCVLQIIG